MIGNVRVHTVEHVHTSSVAPLTGLRFSGSPPE